MNVLVADDDKRIIKMLSKILVGEHFTVDTALDGKEAFEKAKTKKYELIVLDLMMPKKSGFDIIKALRVLKVSTPILVISARLLVEDRVYALNLGADDYLVKNFALKEFVARAKSLIRRSANKSTNILRCGDLVVNFSDMMVYRKQSPIYLSKKEFNILMVLLKKKNAIVTREELIQSVWGKDMDKVPSNTLDVHIRFLRKKISLPSDKKNLIRTFRGRGYMLTDSQK